MALDAAIPHRASAQPRLRVAAIPARVVLAAIVGVNFAIRLVTDFSHTIPLYFPDEYIYSAIARSLAETGKPLVRGGPAHFPALLEPLLASPFWLFHDPAIAYRLTQAEHSLAMSLAAVPMYLLARRLGLGQAFALGCAVVAVVCPDLMYVTFLLAEPIAYPFALTAIYAGVCALDRPSRRGQLLFLFVAVLATAARVQFVFLPIAFLGAALVVERGRIRAAVTTVRLSLVLLAVPVLALVALGPSRLLGYYSNAVHSNMGLSLVEWMAKDALLLAYASGWILVPAAVVGIALAVARPASRAEAAFGGLALFTLTALLVEAGVYASNGTERFQERYLMVFIPLMAPAFGLCLRRGQARRWAVPLLALVMLVAAARVPLSSYTVFDNKQDSPFLFAVYQLERLLDPGTASLVVAALAALLSLAAAGLALLPSRRTAAAVSLGATVAVAVIVSVAAISYDNSNTHRVRNSLLPADARWVDHQELGTVDLVETDGTPPEDILQQLFWNTSVHRLLRLEGAPQIDAFAAPAITVARDGRLLVAGQPTRRPLLVSKFAGQARLVGVEQVQTTDLFSLYRPVGTPRLSLLAAGLYADGWLASGGRITVWPQAQGSNGGTLSLRLSLPPGPSSLRLHLEGPGIERTVTVQAGGHRSLVLAVHGSAPWVLHFRGLDPGRLADGRTISMKAAVPVFTPARAGPDGPTRADATAAA